MNNLEILNLAMMTGVFTTKNKEEEIAEEYEEKLEKCEYCKHCRFPRSANDNNGLCKCKIMKNKTIDVYVGGGETPAWCPLKEKETKS